MIVGLVVFTQLFASNAPILFSNARYHALPEQFYEFEPKGDGFLVARPKGNILKTSYGISASIQYGKLADDFLIYGSPKGITGAEVLVYFSPDLYRPDFTTDSPSRQPELPIIGGECEIRAGTVSGPTMAIGKFIASQITRCGLEVMPYKTTRRFLHCVSFGFPNVRLEPGRYWLVFGVQTADPTARAYCPYLFMDGGSPFPNSNAKTFDSQTKQWSQVAPSRSKAAELPFVARGQ